MTNAKERGLLLTVRELEFCLWDGGWGIGRDAISVTLLTGSSDP